MAAEERVLTSEDGTTQKNNTDPGEVGESQQVEGGGDNTREEKKTTLMDTGPTGSGGDEQHIKCVISGMGGELERQGKNENVGENEGDGPAYALWLWLESRNT